MKKILLLTAMVMLAVTSCLKFEEPKSLAPSTVNAPEIVISAVGDSTFTATITPASGTNFYSFAVLAGEVNPKVSASNLLTVKVGSGIAEGLVDVKNEATKTVVVKGLMPNTNYTVYAAATSEQGQATAVVTATTQTSDKLAPKLKSFSAGKDGSVSITFSEAVKVNKDGKAFATYYKVNNPEDATTIDVPAAKITVKGNTATFPVVKNVPGAYVIYTFEKGLFKDAVDSIAAGYSVNSFDVKDGKVTTKGLASRIPTKSFDLTWTEENEKGDTLVYFSDPSTVVPMFEAPGRVLSVLDEEADWVVKVRHNYNGTEYLYPVSNYGYLNDTTFAFMFDEEPEYTTGLDILVAEGVMEDEYGNTNNAFERESAYMRLLASTGIEGEYAYTYNGDKYSIYFEKVDDENVLVYAMDPVLASIGALLGQPAYGPVKGKYDSEEGTVTISFGQEYNTLDLSPLIPSLTDPIDFFLLTFDEEGYLTDKGSVVFDVLENGCLECTALYSIANPDLGYLTDPIEFEDQLFIKMSNTFEAPTASAAKASHVVKSNYVELRKF
ncbi:MAG: hypothetical protein II318_06085 [Bacteroidales bacterium]|nr:hypothetical protein [Bacteroidales bacterium]